MNKKLLAVIIGAVVLALVVAILLMGRNSAQEPQKNVPRQAAALIGQAKALEAKGELAKALAAYQELIANYFSSAQVIDWQKKLEDINIKLLFSPVETRGSAIYTIKPGDSLAKIAAEFKTTPELVSKSNNISGDRILPGRKIKIWKSPFTIFVDKSQNILILKSDEEVIKTYVVSTGKNNCTPVGTFKITNKLINPTWFKAGAVVASGAPENILGTRWMGFDLAGYGIHGTTEPQYLGQQVTQGCVRMANSDVEELYTIVPAGTEVTITD